MLGNEEGKIETTKKSTVVFVMFYIFGTISHMPQSFYITANDYWMYKFRNVTEASLNTSETAEKTDLQTNFTAYYSIVSNISMIVGLLVSILIRKIFSIQARVLTSLSSLSTLLVITIVFAFIDTDSWQTAFFIISLIIGVFLNGMGACFLLSIFEIVMKFPPVYLGALLSGQSICGIVSTLIQILTLAMGTSSTINAFMYFIIGVIFIVFVEVIFVRVLARHPYYQDRMNENKKEARLAIDFVSVLKVAKKIAVLLITMVLTAGSCITMHPGVTTLVESTNKGHGRWGDTFFVPVCTFLTYNVIDVIGRECAVRFPWVKNKYLILTLAILRLALLPVLLFCNIQPRNHLQVIFGQDWQYFLWFALFSFTNGYMLNLFVVRMPSVCNKEEMKIASVLIVLLMLGSIGICSVLTPVVIALV